MLIAVLLLWVLLSSPKGQASTPEATITALTEFKRQIVGGAGAELLRSWQANASYCDWEGVSCDSHGQGRVLGIVLSGLGLQGTMSGPALSNLTFLRYLDLSNNSISGAIPPFPHRLQTLILHQNHLSGVIPSALGNLTELQTLSLNTNPLSGAIPSTLGNLAELQILSLFSSNLTGSIPSELCNCSSLYFLDLSLNNLMGSIPHQIGAIPFTSPPSPEVISTLNLRSNLLGGAIPSQLANCTQLQVLDLSNNTLSGAIPFALGSLTELGVLSLLNNKLSGGIPSTLGNLAELQILSLHNNNLTGSIPRELCNCSSLHTLDLSLNHLTGSIPHQIGAIPFTNPNSTLNLRQNLLGGVVPSNLGNCSGLHMVYLHNNKLEGSIPGELCKLTNLQELILTINYLTGQVLPCLGKLVSLQILAIDFNNLTGTIPEIFSNLTALSTVDLGFNALTGSVPWSLGFLAHLDDLSLIDNHLSGPIPQSLANCTNLSTLELHTNHLNGPLPTFIAGFPRLSWLDLSVNHFNGSIPSVFGKLHNLQRLHLEENQLHGPIPAELGDCGALSELDLQGNRLHGPLPPQLGKLSSLQYVHLQWNAFQGHIPDILGKCRRLEEIDLSHNNFSGAIPLSLFSLPYLHVSLVLSHNMLTGTIPNEVGNLHHILFIDFSYNKLSGIIPGKFGKCVDLQTLNLSHNKLQGQIPIELGTLLSLVSLDLSTNQLMGPIPASLVNFTASSFADNPGICGPPLVTPCPELGKHTQYKNVPRSTIVFLSCGVTVIILTIASGLLLWCTRCGPLSSKKRALHQDSRKTASSLRVTAEELHVATGGFDKINLIGTGGTSKVYKATLREGQVVAVKKFNWEDNFDKAEYFFHKECETLGKMRHRNLVRILSTCCNLELKALVLEYMPNGSLEKLLFESEGHQLNWRRLIDIALDVAQALVYLHHECDAPIIHCDLKPSNILLDEVYTAHVSDFGIARILSAGNDSYSASYFRGSIGYIAPECAELAHNSVKGDIYSYGVVLLCMLTGKQPTSEVFYEQGIEMPNWVRLFWPDKYLDALHPALRLRVEAGNQEKEALDLMEVALSCTAKAPKERPTSTEIVQKLLHIKAPLIIRKASF